jgi:NAD(P)-dependent dehydrogenase (short-subunit alcohol dehydrogenase family)
MTGSVCLITGGNAGIGRAAALQLARAGARVVIACRDPERGAAAVDAIRAAVSGAHVDCVAMDLSSRRSIEAGSEAFRLLGHGGLDVLIHNAADFDIARNEPHDSDEGVESVWATNHIGPVALTHTLDPELTMSEQARVITVSSQGLVLHPFLRVDLADPEFRSRRFRVASAYYQSKLAQVMYTFWLAERFRGTAKTANCIRVTNVQIDTSRYPGLTPLQRRMYVLKSRFSITAEGMAETYTALALDPAFTAVSGGYFDEHRRRVGAGAWASDPRNVRDVMTLTARYVPGLEV